MIRAQLLVPTLLTCLLLAPTLWAEEEPGEGAFQYDAVNMRIEKVIEQATAADKPIFLEFFTEG